MRKPAFCICENKEADQLRSNCEADQHLCFRYTDSAIPLLPKSKKFQASSHLLWLHSPVCVGPGRKPRRPVFSQRGSYKTLEAEVSKEVTDQTHVNLQADLQFQLKVCYLLMHKRGFLAMWNIYILKVLMFRTL